MARFHAWLKNVALVRRSATLPILACLLAVHPAAAQGPRVGIVVQPVSATRTAGTLHQSLGPAEGRSTAHAARTGALIGAFVGVVTSSLVYGFCRDDDTASDPDCTGRAALILGLDTAVGTLIGLLVGGTDPDPALAR